MKSLIDSAAVGFYAAGTVAVVFLCRAAHDVRETQRDIFEALTLRNEMEAAILAMQVRTYHHVAGHTPELTGPIHGCPECAEILQTRGENRMGGWKVDEETK